MNYSINQGNPPLIIVQTTVPHYRIQFFSALSHHPELNAKFFCSEKDLDGNLKTVHGETQVDYTIVKTRYWKSAYFQFLPRIVFEAPVAILGFEVRCISTLLVLLYRKIRRKKTILWGHGLSNEQKPAFVYALRKGIAQIADALIFYDEQRKAYYEKVGIPSEKLFVAANTIDLEVIKESAQQAPSTDERTQILYIGRLITAKKVDQLIKAFSIIYNDISPNIELTIIGDGPEMTNLQQLVASMELENRVHFAGEILDEACLAKYFAKALVMVSPGYLGLAAIHSLAYSVPVIMPADEPHSPEATNITDGVTGFTYSPTTPEALSQKLVESLNNPDKLHEMGQTGQRFVYSQYSIDSMVQAFLAAVRFVRRS